MRRDSQGQASRSDLLSMCMRAESKKVAAKLSRVFKLLGSQMNHLPAEIQGRLHTIFQLCDVAGPDSIS